MIKNIMENNKNVKATNKNVEILKKYFPGCFDNQGNFDIVKFQAEIND